LVAKEDKLVKKGQQTLESQDRTVGTGQPGQDSENRTGQPEQDTITGQDWDRSRDSFYYVNTT
jgi:hypothetical protein